MSCHLVAEVMVPWHFARLAGLGWAHCGQHSWLLTLLTDTTQQHISSHLTSHGSSLHPLTPRASLFLLKSRTPWDLLTQASALAKPGSMGYRLRWADGEPHWLTLTHGLAPSAVVQATDASAAILRPVFPPKEIPGSAACTVGS